MARKKITITIAETRGGARLFRAADDSWQPLAALGEFVPKAHDVTAAVAASELFGRKLAGLYTEPWPATSKSGLVQTGFAQL